MLNTSGSMWMAASVALCATSGAAAQQAGSVRGIVTDRDFGAPVALATVTVVETGAKVQASEQGTFVIADLAPGTYTLVFSKDGYLRQVKTGVAVLSDSVAEVDVQLAGEYEDMDEFVVQEIELGESEGALLQLRIETPQLLDTVGAELLSKAGASDAAAALLLVPGASVQDGKYAVVRGLPDRYVSAQLDGVRLPTSDAERRAVQLDQFPSAILQSVQVSKTFTPDQQGDASGGAVNIDLKDIPDETSIQLKIQGGFNSQVQKADNFLSYDGGRPGHWGDFNGAGIQDDLIGQSWPNPVGTEPSEIPGADYKWSIAGGGKWEVEEGVKVGAFASLFYERDSSYFDNGVEDSWFVTPSEGLVPEYSQGTPSQFRFQSNLLDVEQGSQSTQWGTLVAGGVETETNRFGATYLYTSTAVSTSTLATNTRGKAYFCGPAFDWSFSGFIFDPLPAYDPNDPTSIANTDLYECSPYQRLETLDYTETVTESFILKGEHKLFADGVAGAFDNAVLDWTLSSSTASFDQPDKTQFSAIWFPASIYYGDPIWLSYAPAENINLGWVQHIKQTIDETSEQASVNVKLPFTNDNERTGYFKMGVFADQVERQYRQETYSNRGSGSYAGGWDDPWSAVFPQENSPIFASEFDIDYDGLQRLGAFYMMADVPIADTWSLIGGARMENSTLQTTVDGDQFATWYDLDSGQVINFTQNPDAANVDRKDTLALPMIGAEWVIEEGVVFRSAYTQTVARQTFREITPIIQQEYLGGPIFIGNPDLGLSSLDNWDLRLDVTPAEGWFASASWFYKRVFDAIEYAQFDSPGGFTFTAPVNYPDGELMGIEAEVRFLVGDLNKTLDGLSLGLNATFIDSEVTLPEDEQEAFEQAGFPLTTRDMTAAPAYLFNANATYEVKPTGTTVSLFYTVTGDTLVAGAGLDDGINFVPSIYALPYGTLNFTLQQDLGGVLEGLKLFFQAKNLLNPEIETVYRSDYLPNGDVLNTSYTAGIDFALGLSWQVDF